MVNLFVRFLSSVSPPTCFMKVVSRFYLIYIYVHTWALPIRFIPRTYWRAQGFVLGSISFVMFTNDLNTVLACKVIFKLFADDFNLYSSFKDSQHSSIQKSPHLVSAWASIWQVPSNHSTSKHFHLGLVSQFPPYEIGGYNIPQLETIADFCITINSKHNYNARIVSISNKTHSPVCIVLRRLYSHKSHVIPSSI